MQLSLLCETVFVNAICLSQTLLCLTTAVQLLNLQSDILDRVSLDGKNMWFRGMHVDDSIFSFKLFHFLTNFLKPCSYVFVSVLMP